MKWYTSCEELPLYNFIRMVVESDYRFILKKPFKEQKDINLSEKWEIVFEEYTVLTGNVSNKALFSLLKDIYGLEIKLRLTYSCIDYLTQWFNQDLCDVLKSMGYDGEFTIETMEKDLRNTFAEAKRLTLQLRDNETDYNATGKNDKEPTAKDFQSLLVHLSKFVGFKLDSKNLTVAEFVSFLDEYNNFNKPQSLVANE